MLSGTSGPAKWPTVAPWKFSTWAMADGQYRAVLEIPPLPDSTILLVEVGSTAPGTGLLGGEATRLPPMGVGPVSSLAH